MNFTQTIALFQEEMISKRVTPPSKILDDGQLHRFHIEGDKSGSKTGWYILFTNNLPCGVFGNWKLGITSKWCSKNRSQMNARELIHYREQIKIARRKHDEERAKQQKIAAQLAEKIWHQCKAADPYHPYLVRKQILPFYARQSGKNIVLPIIDFSGEFSSLQFINDAGEKRFLSNGKITGNYIPIQKEPASDLQIMIAESFSTAGSIAQAYPNACVIAACHASNLKPVAVCFRHHFSDSNILICADDDRGLPTNIGLIKAKEAAFAAKALFTKPNWPTGAPESLTDFNDLACWLQSMELKNEHY